MRMPKKFQKSKIKKLGLEDKIKELGIKPISNEMEDKDLEQLRDKMVNKMNNNN